MFTHKWESVYNWFDDKQVCHEATQGDKGAHCHVFTKVVVFLALQTAV